MILCAFLSNTMNMGILSSFGLFLDNIMEEFKTTNLIASMAGSLAFGFTVGTAPVSTALYTIFGARKVAYTGAVLAVTSIQITASSSNVAVLFVFYSFGFGVAGNFMYNIFMNLIGDSFKKDTIAVGTCFASIGVAFGTLVMNPVAANLMAWLGWRNTLRIICTVGFVVNVLCITFLPAISLIAYIDRRKLPEKEREEADEIVFAMVEDEYDFVKHAVPTFAPSDTTSTIYGDDYSMYSTNSSVFSKISVVVTDIKEIVFTRAPIKCTVCCNMGLWLWIIATYTRSIAFFFPQIFLVDYQVSDLGMTKELAAWTLTVYGVSDTFGRLSAGIFGDRVPFNLAYLYVIACAICGIVNVILSVFSWRPYLYIYVVFLGYWGGIYGSLEFAATMEIFGRKNGFYVWGFMNVALMVGFVNGPIIVGALLDSGYTYNTGFLLAAGFLFLSTFTTAFIPCAAQRRPIVDQKDREEARKRMRQVRKVRKQQRRAQRRQQGLSDIAEYEYQDYSELSEYPEQ